MPRGQEPPGTRLVRLAGDIDVLASQGLRVRLLDVAVAGAGDVVVDLAKVTLLSAAGVTALVELADVLAGSGRRLRLVVTSEHVRGALAASHAADLVDTYPSVGAAVSARAVPEGIVPGGRGDRLSRLGQEVRELRAKLSTRPVIARALGMVQERYRLPDLPAAQRLLRDGSQHGNVKLYALARVLVELPRPGPDGPWLTGELRPAAPSVPFPAVPPQGWTADAVLVATLEAAMRCTGAGAGAVHAQHGGRLRMVANRGAPGGGQVVHSASVLAGDGHCLAVVSVRHGRAEWRPTGAQRGELDRIATGAGRWLDWWERDTVLGALEHLHRIGTGSR